MTGTIDGTLGVPTKTALGRYMSIEGQPTDDVSVTEALVTELTKHTTRVCPLECKAGETVKGETCVAAEKPAAPATASQRKNDDEDDAGAPQAGEPGSGPRSGAAIEAGAGSAPCPSAGRCKAEYRQRRQQQRQPHHDRRRFLIVSPCRSVTPQKHPDSCR